MWETKPCRLNRGSSSFLVNIILLFPPKNTPLIIFYHGYQLLSSLLLCVKKTINLNWNDTNCTYAQILLKSNQHSMRGFLCVFYQYRVHQDTIKNNLTTIVALQQSLLIYKYSLPHPIGTARHKMHQNPCIEYWLLFRCCLYQKYTLLNEA